MEDIARKLADLTDQDLTDLDKYNNRVRKLTERANERNCQLYVDAE